MRAHLLAVILLSAASQVPLAHADPKPIATRFGPLTWNTEGQLQFRGSSLAVEYNEGWPEPLSTITLPDSDVILLQQSQGNSCPGMFVFVTVTMIAATVTSPFGTCYDELPEAVLKGNEITVQMPGNDGPVTYRYQAGRVTRK